MKEKKTTTISISIDKDVLKEIKEKAKKENRSLSNYITQKLKER